MARGAAGNNVSDVFSSQDFPNPIDMTVEVRGIPHLAKNERDTLNFLYSALDTTACAPFFKERRIKFGGTH
jgi:hypothetical protein